MSCRAAVFIECEQDTAEGRPVFLEDILSSNCWASSMLTAARLVGAMAGGALRSGRAYRGAVEPQCAGSACLLR